LNTSSSRVAVLAEVMAAAALAGSELARDLVLPPAPITPLPLALVVLAQHAEILDQILYLALLLLPVAVVAARETLKEPPQALMAARAAAAAQIMPQAVPVMFRLLAHPKEAMEAPAEQMAPHIFWLAVVAALLR